MADLTRDALADKVDDIAIVLCDEYAKTLHKASAVLRQGVRDAREEEIDRLIAQREEARKIAEEFRENVSRYNTEIPYIPLPWDPK